MTYRCFAEADEKTADGWSMQPEAVDQWTLGNNIGRGEAGAFHGTSDKGCRAACKPAFGANGTPRAAHERIASDLARGLLLPVPPVCLWTNPATQDLFAISAWAFGQALTWGGSCDSAISGVYAERGSDVLCNAGLPFVDR
jgi:hypothetical protein